MKFCMVLLLSMLLSVNLYSEISIKGYSVGQKLYVYGYCDITWSETDFVGLVKIELWDARTGKFYTIGNSVESSKLTYNWYISNPGWVGNRFRIKISELSKPDKYKLNDYFFEIFPQQNGNNSTIGNGDYNPLEIFPNPAVKSIFIKINGNIDDIFTRMQLVSLAGEKLQTLLITNNYEIVYGLELNIENLKPGAYIIELNGRRNRYSNKFVKL